MLRGKSDVYVLVAAARRGFKMVLRPTAAVMRGFTTVLFTEAVSRRNTFVGGTCAPLSALLVKYMHDCVCHYVYSALVVMFPAIRLNKLNPSRLFTTLPC